MAFQWLRKKKSPGEENMRAVVIFQNGVTDCKEMMRKNSSMTDGWVSSGDLEPARSQERWKCPAGHFSAQGQECQTET